GQRCAVRAEGHLVKDALGIHVLVALGEQRVPVVVDFPQRGHAYALVGHRVDGVGDKGAVVDGHRAGRYLAGWPRWVTVRAAAGRIVAVVDADVARLAGKGARHVVDVAAAPVG